MIGRSSMLRLTDGYLQTSLLAEVHGVQAKLNAGIIISVIWMFFECLRIDPIDNQRGEFEYEDHGLRFSQVEVSQKLISMEDIEK